MAKSGLKIRNKSYNLKDFNSTNSIVKITVKDLE